MTTCCCCGHRIAWEPSTTGTHIGTVWLCSPGLTVYHGPADQGFDLGCAIKFRNPETRRRILEELLAAYPMARVPR